MTDPFIVACLEKARIARQRADDLEVSAATRLRDLKEECERTGVSFNRVCKRRTGLPYRKAKDLLYLLWRRR